MNLINHKPSFDKGVLVFRILSAMALLRAHGLPKLLNFQETLAHIPDPLGLGSMFSAYYAVFTNVFCAILVALGLFTRVAAFFIVTLTLSGLFLIHLDDGPKIQDTPLIYAIVFGFLTYVGAGYYSLDDKLRSKVYEI